MKKLGLTTIIIGLFFISSCSNKEEYCSEMSLSEAKEIAISSTCVNEGILKENHMCNENTNTWWIDLQVEDNPLCNPACVINTETKEAEINWRCTGLIN